MKPSQMAMLLVLLAGADPIQGADGPGPASPSPAVQPATKKELPWLDVPGGRMKTTLFYGPWQCRREFMRMCQKECAQEGHPLMGCMWLADIKLEWEGRLVIPPLPVKAGSRYGIFHCCCNYSTLPKTVTEAERRKWEKIREAFREAWGKRFGEWPVTSNKAWPGHHIRDLWHGGDPVDPNNIIPVEPGVHDMFTKLYPMCYSGQAPWTTVGPNLPYSDN
jgi:hypothetical protein